MLRGALLVASVACALSAKIISSSVRGAKTPQSHVASLAVQKRGIPPPENEPDRLPLDAQKLPEQGFDETGPDVGHVDMKTKTDDWRKEIPEYKGEKEVEEASALRSNANRVVVGVRSASAVLA